MEVEVEDKKNDGKVSAAPRAAATQAPQVRQDAKTSFSWLSPPNSLPLYVVETPYGSQEALNFQTSADRQPQVTYSTNGPEQDQEPSSDDDHSDDAGEPAVVHE